VAAGRLRRWGLKLINPREGQDDGDLPYRRLIDRLINANARLKLPHSLHLHHPFLGRADAYEPITETIRQTEGRPLHFAHLQFNGYSRSADGKMTSAAEHLAELVNAHKNITCDVGAVTFGPAAAVTADANFAKKLGRGKRGFQSQWWESDGAFGVLPLKYEADKIAGATQFLPDWSSCFWWRTLPEFPHDRPSQRRAVYRLSVFDSTFDG
jgi:formylmethanofuran dehydrogenase subunit A